MRDRHQLITLASAAALALALTHNVLAAEGDTTPAEAAPAATAPAETPTAVTEAEVTPAPAQPAETTPEAAAAPAEPAPTTEAAAAPTEAAAPPTPAEVARQRSEQRRADAMEQRGLRYEELRQRAAMSGVELPETPPWEQTVPPEMPSFPAMPSGVSDKGMMSAEERAAQIDKMRSMTPEERMAQREAHWAKMRERAAERGIELPETPPWKAAMERRKAMQEQWDAYRKTIEEMSDEQREAAQAVFGRYSPADRPASFGGQPYPGAEAGPKGFVHPAMPTGGYGPCGPRPCQGYSGRGMMPHPQMMYRQGAPSGAQAPVNNQIG